MTYRFGRSLICVATLTALGVVAPGIGRAQQKPQVQIPQPGVPEIMTLEGNWIRAAYNNEGYVILGYRLAQETVGDPWMLLEVGMTVREGKPAYELQRGAISLDTPTGKTVPLPTNVEFQKANLRGLERRAEATRDNINYFPPLASQACRIGFFADLDVNSPRAWDVVELTHLRACVGRLFFPIEGGIAHGQYWLNVKFHTSVVRVPFRIMTKEEQKVLTGNFRDIQKQVEEAFKRKS
jgi:hypothetical protein